MVARHRAVYRALDATRCYLYLQRAIVWDPNRILRNVDSAGTATMTTIDEIRQWAIEATERCKKATKPPWRVFGDKKSLFGAAGVCQADDEDEIAICGGVPHEGWMDPDGPDTKFIAAARIDLPYAFKIVLEVCRLVEAFNKNPPRR